ncbi:hypothetical protein TIFTF001_035484 [Ficus carica]|uniref:Uncharacterized protein n=1 Tax=Ficus carica TaxID=3494 RepID=A0AA88JBS3_FICCA|nr:hypothetical protein TIFTF001_035484 [Ficus carica]
MNGGFDLRLVIPIFMNLLKSFSEALPWDWDAFGMFDPKQTSWTKVSFHVLQLLFFSSTSITFILLFRPWPNSALIRFRFGDFSPHIAFSHVCSLVFPQALFWCMSPAILVVNHFLGWFKYVKLSALPVWNLHISSTLTRHEETDAHNIIVESEVPVAQVSISVSPGDGDSVAEG